MQDEVHIDAVQSIETLEILQFDGTLVYSLHPNEQSAHISLAGLNPGMYLVNVKTTAGSESYRFVKN